MKKCVKMCVSMFEMWKLLSKQADQTGPYKFLTYFPLTETIVNNNERIDEVTLFDTSWQKQIYIYIYILVRAACVRHVLVVEKKYCSN